MGKGIKRDYGFTWNNLIITCGGVKQFYLTPQLCRVHKRIIFSRFIFSPFFCPVKYFYLTLKKVSLFILFFIDLSSCLKRSFSLVGSFPSFLLPLSLLVLFPLFLYPPVPSFHPKRKGFFLVNLSYGNKKKITPLIAPPYTPPRNFGGMSGFPPRIFSPFFRGYPTPSNFFPFFRGGITFMGFTS